MNSDLPPEDHFTGPCNTIDQTDHSNSGLIDCNNSGNMQPGHETKWEKDKNANAWDTMKVSLHDILGGSPIVERRKDPRADQEPAVVSKKQQYRRRMTFESPDPGEIKFQSLALEGSYIERGAWAGHSLAVFTSGGDSQGMNAAVRAIVRMGLYLGCKVFYIKEGYQGMVDGEENIVMADWSSTSNIIDMGGTVIGSARCMPFKERWGRLKSAHNLIKHRITNLIAIGGDGSLTGANCFRQEWPSLLRELVDTGQVSKEVAVLCGHLNVVGLVGSIDNDFCGTDMTIGVDSALHRIMQAIDDIMTTAVSHKRAFVLEVMGRHCGHLPLMAGIAGEASAIFIPEHPPSPNWRDELCELLQEKSRGGEVRRTHIIIVAEGAVDSEGNDIKCAEVKQCLSDRLKLDTRVTVLGHVQRGGNTSAFDRNLGTRMGAEAVLALMDATPDTPACVICLKGSDIVRKPLMKCVEKVKLLGEKLEACDFEAVIQLRGKATLSSLKVFLMQQQVLSQRSDKARMRTRVAMVHVGKPACGMNACCRGFVSVCLANGVEPVFIHDSWEGLIEDKVMVPTWNSLHHWTHVGGSNLGIKAQTAEEAGLKEIASKLAQHRISGLVIVGGFEAFESAVQLVEGRATLSELCIPINVIPATIDNNVPGTEHAVGTDTALNRITLACDELKMSAFSVKKCVYIVEVGGENCGYLATLGSMAAGADASYILEEKFTIKDVKTRCNKLAWKLTNTDVKHGLVIRNENANANMTTDFMYRLFNEEGKPAFIARKSVLGYIQEGNKASPHDRYTGITAGCRSAAWMILTMHKVMDNTGKVYTEDPRTVTVSSSGTSFVPVLELVESVDFENRLPKHQWWMKLRPLLKILSHNKQNNDKCNEEAGSSRDSDNLIKFES